MSARPHSKLRRFIGAAIALTPWIVAMYLFYWLDSSGTWTRETPHRGKLSVALLATGMALSLFAWARLAKLRQK